MSLGVKPCSLLVFQSKLLMHMQASIADRFLLVFNLSSQIVSCRSTHEQNNGWTSDLGVFKNVSISTFPNYYEAVMQTCEIPAILVLHEDENTMYAFKLQRSSYVLVRYFNGNQLQPDDSQYHSKESHGDGR